MVLATEMMAPTAIPWVVVQPDSHPIAAPSPTENNIPNGPPTIATHFTCKSS
jgi:hypothetical protein